MQGELSSHEITVHWVHHDSFSPPAPLVDNRSSSHPSCASRKWADPAVAAALHYGMASPRGCVTDVGRPAGRIAPTLLCSSNHGGSCTSPGDDPASLDLTVPAWMGTGKYPLPRTKRTCWKLSQCSTTHFDVVHVCCILSCPVWDETETTLGFAYAL